VDQDKAGKQARRTWKSGDQEIWVRTLDNGDRAVALFNLGAEASGLSAKWKDLGVGQTPSRARDLWAHRDVALQGPEYTVTVPAHGVVMLRIQGASK
jgi:alpha-galactosidase